MEVRRTCVEMEPDDFARFIQCCTSTESGISFLTGAGVIQASFDQDLVSIELTSPENTLLNQEIVLDGTSLTVHSMNTGVPHAVVFVEDVDKVDVAAWGRALRNHPLFSPDGTNVNFAQVIDSGHLRVRTYERGG